MESNYMIKDAIGAMGASIHGNQTRIQCPECGPSRRKSREKTLSVKIESDHALYQCYHCDISGRVSLVEDTYTGKKMNGTRPMDSVVVANEVGETRALEDAHLEWFAKRLIDKDTIDRCGIVAGDVWLKPRKKMVSCVGFSYDNPDGSQAIKWRDSLKNFSQSGSAASLWRINLFEGGDLVICEGELDALSYEQVLPYKKGGIFATSVPNGAPSKVSSGNNSKKYNYLWEARDALAKADRIIIATDTDEPGQLLAEELVRRVGRGKCWRVQYPGGNCKDASDVLVVHGAEALKDTLEKAIPWPVSGIRDASEFRERAVQLYEGGMDRGVPMGMEDLDRIYKTTPQCLTIFTGIPGSGKSAFLTWLSVNLASKSGWRSVVMSFEVPTEIHVLQMAACYLGKPFHGPNKMTQEELRVALDWVQNNFTFLSEADTTISSVLERASVSIMRHGARILQIDPFNFLTTSENSEDSVLKINELLVGLKQFAVDRDVCVWLVAHPMKMYRSSDGSVPTPGGYDVSGSAAFFNASDCGVTLSRGNDGESVVSVWKSRFPWIGSLGQATLSIDVETGVFSAPILGDGVGEEDFDFDDF